MNSEHGPGEGGRGGPGKSAKNVSTKNLQNLKRESRSATSKCLKIMNIKPFFSIRAFRYDAYAGTPHSAIFQDKSMKILKSKPGAPHSAMKSITD